MKTLNAIQIMLFIIALFVIGLLIKDKSYQAHWKVLNQIKEKQLVEKVIAEHNKASKNYVVTLKPKKRR